MLPWLPILGIVLLSGPFVCCIANIMLANNLCDMEDDRANNRHTLPVITGKAWGMRLFHLLYLAAGLCVVAAVILGFVPLTAFLVFVVTPKVLSNLSKFRITQTKKDTFALSVMNFLLICGGLAGMIGLGCLLR